MAAPELFDPVTLATLGMKYQINGWVKNGFKKLITRPEAPSLEDGVALGMERVLAICRCREIYKPTRGTVRSRFLTPLIYNLKERPLPESLIAKEPSLRDPLHERLDEVRFLPSTGDGNP
ncbi:hypothetical protein FRC01_014871, partial [Tulasnella sp. 417]